MNDRSRNRRELANFLRSRRSRISAKDVGLPAGQRRRAPGLRREEVAVLAGLSPTWYTYLEQARDVRPSAQVLDSLARALRLTEDERRYIHILTHGRINHPRPLDDELPMAELLKRTVDSAGRGPYPLYAANHTGDVIAWNEPAAEWYDDWSRFPQEERNMLRWMFTSPVARQRLPDWADEARNMLARWRGENAKWPDDGRGRRLIAELTELSPDFSHWWKEHDVREHRPRLRRFRLPPGTVRTIRIVPVVSYDFQPVGIVFHVPV